MADQDNEEQRENGRSNKEKGDEKGIIALLTILFLPAFIVGWLFYCLLRFGKFRFSLIVAVAALVDMIAVAVFFGTDALNKFIYVVNNITAIKDLWPDLLPFIITVSMLLGSFIGLFLTRWSIHQMNANPHQLLIPGTWKYGFKYRHTPWDMRRKKKIIEGLKKGTYESLEKAPMGLSEETEFLPVFRFENEANTHTLITGASGSGKTVSMLNLIHNDIRSAIATIVIDNKGDPELASKISTWCADNKRNFYHFSNGAPEKYDIPNSPGQCFYDPLSSGNATEKAGMLMGMREYDQAAAVYKANMQTLTQTLMNALAQVDRNNKLLYDVAYRFVKTPLKTPAENWNFENIKGGEVLSKEKFLLSASGVGGPAFRSSSLNEFITAHQKKTNNGVKYIYNEVSSSKLEDFLLQLGVIKTVNVSRIKWSEGGLYAISSALKGNNFETLISACEGKEMEEEGQEVLEELRSTRKGGSGGMNHAIGELKGQLRTLTVSEYGRWLKLSEDKRHNIDLYELTQDPNNVILFSLNSDSEKDFVPLVGALLMADLTNVSVRRRENKILNPLHIYIDEFQIFNPSSVTGLLEKARSSKISMTLSLQSFEQIIKSADKNGEAYLNSILDTCSNFLVHNGAILASAERISGVIGKHEVDVYSSSQNNKGFFLSLNWSNRRDQNIRISKEYKWIAPPELFMKLSSPKPENNRLCTAVIVNKECVDENFISDTGAIARKIRVIPNSDVLTEYYQNPHKKDTSKIEVPTYEEVELEQDEKDLETDNHDNSSLQNLPNDETKHSDFVKISQLEELLDEETDGGFDMEELYDDDSEMATALNISEPSQISSEEEQLNEFKSKREFSFDKFTEEKPKSGASQLNRKNKATDKPLKGAPKEQNSASATSSPPRRGIPLPPVNFTRRDEAENRATDEKSTVHESPDWDGSLPDLD